MLSNDDIQRTIMANPRRYREILAKMSPETVEFIDREFPHLDGFKFSTKLYWHLHGLKDFPTYVCPVCGNTQYLDRNVFSVIDGYNRWLNRTGCSYECSQNNPETVEKKKHTNRERFGVDYTSQRDGHRHFCMLAHKANPHRWSHRQKKFPSKLFPGIRFDSRWELKVYEFCRQNGIEISYSPGISFEYEYQGTPHLYHPDFLIDGKLYEIKGDHFFNEHGQMVNPYDHSQDGRYEAKHQCMLRNNVRILRGDDIRHLSEVFNHASAK